MNDPNKLFSDIFALDADESPGDQWITINGAPVLIGKNGEVKAGAGGNLTKKPSGCARNSPPVAHLTGNELGQKKGESLKDAARRYYQKNLVGHPAHQKEVGEVHFFTTQFNKKYSNTTLSDEERFRLLPAVKHVIEKGEYLGDKRLETPRKDGAVAFHYFEANVMMGGKQKYLGVTVNEDKNGKKFYNMNPDPDILLKAKKQKTPGSQG